jgi:hypothetical protein
MRSTIISLLAAVGLLSAWAPSLAVAQSGEVSAGASYSSLYGATGRVSLSLFDLGAHESALEAYYRGGPDGAEGRFTAQQERDREDGALHLQFTAQIFDWDHLPYESTRLGAEVLREWGEDGPLTFAAGVFADFDDVTGIASRLSTILSRDLGESVSGGVLAGVRHEVGDFDAFFPESLRRSFEVSTRLAAIGDRQYAAVEVSAHYDQPFREGLVFNAGVKAGVISGLDGSYVSVLDRAFQGNDQPRGFEYGGLGPRDPVTDDPLGGTRYYAGTVGVSYKVEDAPAVVSAFIDFGSTWDVPGVSDPALEDGHTLRASAGVALDVELEFGAFQVALAEPFESHAYDQSQTVSISFRARF